MNAAQRRRDGSDVARPRLYAHLPFSWRRDPSPRVASSTRCSGLARRDRDTGVGTQGSGRRDRDTGIGTRPVEQGSGHKDRDTAC
eukprot:5219355-Prymnesium_polylepis.1